MPPEAALAGVEDVALAFVFPEEERTVFPEEVEGLRLEEGDVVNDAGDETDGVSPVFEGDVVSGG